MSKVVVLFAGNAGHGKTLSGDLLDEILKPVATTEKMAFADPIKETAKHLLGIPLSVSYGSQEDKETFKVYNRTARSWLQWIGTNLAREMISSDIWVHRFADRVIESNAGVIIGTDCRFSNEITVLRQMLAVKRIPVVVVRIVNPRIPVNLEHRSESEVYEMSDSMFDATIINDETVDVLKIKLSSLEPIIRKSSVDSCLGSSTRV